MQNASRSSVCQTNKAPGDKILKKPEAALVRDVSFMMQYVV